jgi:hypothetical protein
MARDLYLEVAHFESHCWDPYYFDWSFRGFSQFIHTNVRAVIRISSQQLHFTSLPI